MKRVLVIIFLFSFLMTGLAAQLNQGSVKVSPNGVNVNANGATSVFLTFGGLNNHRPADACWCGELMPATPDIGMKCNPATVFGCLPERYDISTASGNRAFTDIMSIPSSVARRAYQAAEDGAVSSFFYVRRFVNTKGGRDEYAVVTCRMASGGVSVPLSLTDVKLTFADDKPILFVKPGELLPGLRAEIAYNGTGRLKGRWEVVTPGDELPSVRDLLTEGSLPIEERGLQRRYTQLSTFNVFLTPTGKTVLEGPDTSRLPSAVEGPYIVLLRVEVTDDKDGGSNLGQVGGARGFVNSGAVAGFPLPVLRYFVGSAPAGASTTSASALSLVLPGADAAIASDKLIDFVWGDYQTAAFYRLEVEDSQARPVLSALLQRGKTAYSAPPWLKDRVVDGLLRWRVVAFGPDGVRKGESIWRALRLE